MANCCLGSAESLQRITIPLVRFFFIMPPILVALLYYLYLYFFWTYTESLLSKFLGISPPEFSLCFIIGQIFSDLISSSFVMS